MKDIRFFSDNTYIILPKKKNPKVYLAIDNQYIKKNSFRLYNPFSFKAKMLKKIAFYLPFFNLSKQHKSEFITYLENKLNKNFISSIYMATDKDKVVLQLQENDTVFGYVKIALNENGEKKLRNEYYAIKRLQNINKIDVIMSDYFDENYFFITRDIGEIASLGSIDIYPILNRLKRDDFFDYKNHPRIIYIYEQIKRIDKSLLIYLDNLIFDRKLQLVYEHGDFAPWNILSNRLIFDFEYFFADGLACLDEIKYFYQVETLLKNTSMDGIMSNVFSSIHCEEKKEFFMLFLLKEIVIKDQENQDFSYEAELLGRVAKR